jgi:hypothetical protein
MNSFMLMITVYSELGIREALAFADVPAVPMQNPYALPKSPVCAF